MKEAMLYPGEIDPTAEAIESKTGYEVYQLPEITSAREWYETFEGDFEIIVLISDGKIMLPVGGLEATAEEESETTDEESETEEDCAEGKYQVTVTAEGAAAVLPGVLNSLEPDVAHRIVKMADREAAVRVL